MPSRYTGVINDYNTSTKSIVVNICSFRKLEDNNVYISQIHRIVYCQTVFNLYNSPTTFRNNLLEILLHQ